MEAIEDAKSTLLIDFNSSKHMKKKQRNNSDKQEEIMKTISADEILIEWKILTNVCLTGFWYKVVSISCADVVSCKCFEHFGAGVIGNNKEGSLFFSSKRYVQFSHLYLMLTTMMALAGVSYLVSEVRLFLSVCVRLWLCDSDWLPHFPHLGNLIFQGPPDQSTKIEFFVGKKFENFLGWNPTVSVIMLRPEHTHSWPRKQQ